VIVNLICCPRCGEAVPAEPVPPALRCSAEAYALLGRSLARHRQERFYVVSLDSRNRLIRRHLVAVGSLAAVVVHPREVFAPLLRERAAAAIVMHNHPSGAVEPSPEDLEITKRLDDAGRLLGIPLLDHVIVGRSGYFSFRDAGRLVAP
jgi:DNA repair protein RadC